MGGMWVNDTGCAFKYYSQYNIITEVVNFRSIVVKNVFRGGRLSILTFVSKTNSAQEGVTSWILGHWQQCRSSGLDYFHFSATSHRSL